MVLVDGMKVNEKVVEESNKRENDVVQNDVEDNFLLNEVVFDVWEVVLQDVVLVEDKEKENFQVNFDLNLIDNVQPILDKKSYLEDREVCIVKNLVIGFLISKIVY